jgi:hypothetical protein
MEVPTGEAKVAQAGDTLVAFGIANYLLRKQAVKT